MHQITQVEAKDIGCLDGSQLVRLLHVLLLAEARSRNINKTGIHVPFEINVADGGSDGQWDGEIEANDYIPKKLTVFQSKAQDLSPAQCADEMHKENSTDLKSQVKKVLEAGGAYVFFCSHSYNTDQLEKRITKAQEALKNAGRLTWETDEIRFLDATQIAQWVNKHAAALTYVCLCTRIRQEVALRDYKHWSEDPLFEFDFQSNDHVNGFISEIRSTLSEPRGIARITGPSGLGKTRLGFEVFHAPAHGDGGKVREALAASVVYLDMQIYRRAVLGWVNQLALGGHSGVVVVDNCSRENHNILQASILHPTSKLSLLTLDYVPEIPFGDSISHIQMTPEIMRDVVPKILAAVPGLKQTLGEAGIQRVAEFAHGFPQIAILTAKAGHALDLQTLNQQGELANRLLWGWGEEDSDAKEVIRCLSPFAEIGCSGNYAAQLEFIRGDLCRGLSDYNFRRLTQRFRDNRVLQEVGDFLMVAPPPLAAALAADWLECVSDDYFQELLPKIGACGLTESFCRRLRQIDFSPRARALCERLMGLSGSFASAEVLNSEAGSQVFRALSEVNPLAATECLYRVTQGWSSVEFSQIATGRRDLIWTLEKLVWDTSLFPKAAKILLGFAAGETEHWANNATGQFCQLFHIFLPGTQHPAIGRLAVIEEGLRHGDSKVKEVCVEALGAALSSDYFSRTGGSEQSGTRLPMSDYNPANNREIWDYWKAVFMILKRLITESTVLSAKALNTLGGKLSAILSCPLVNELEDEFKLIAENQAGFWPAAREEIKRVLDYRKEIGAEHREIVKRWLGYVTPSDLRNRLKDVVANPGWHHEKGEDGKMNDLSELNAIKLADELHHNGDEWMKHLDVLMEGDQQQTWAFGKRCLELASDQMGLFDLCLNAYSSLVAKDRNPQLLRGMINHLAGTEDAAIILDRIAADSELRGDLLISLTTACATKVRDFERVSTLIKAGDLPPKSVNAFAFGSITAGFEISEFLAELTDLKDRVPEAAPSILYVVFMFCYHHQDRLERMRDLLADLVVMPQVLSALKNSEVGHAWEVCVEFLLRGPKKDFAAQLSIALTNAVTTSGMIGYGDNYVSKAATTLLREHPKDSWPVFSAAVKDEHGKPRFSVLELLSNAGYVGDSGVPLSRLPTEEFRRWVEQNRELVPYFLRQIPLYQTEVVHPPQLSEPTLVEGGEPEEVAALRDVVNRDLNEAALSEQYVWHSHAKVLLDVFGKDYLRGCLNSDLFSFGSTGSRVPYLEKRVALVQGLTRSDNPELKMIAESLIDALQSEIKREQKFDAQRSAGIHAW